MLMARILGVFRLDPGTFESVEHDGSATGQAALIVAIVAVMAGLGSLGVAMFSGQNALFSFLGSFAWTFVSWFLWALITYLIGTSLFKGNATLDEMLRVIGFAFAPQVLAIIPCVGGIIGAVWSLVAGFIAVRQGLDLDDARALLTVAAGFVVYVVGNFLISLLLNWGTAFFR